VAELTKCEAIIHQGILGDAKWFSYGANKTHGLPRTNADKQRAVQAALAHPKAAGMSDVQIAEHCGVHQTTVSEWRKKLEPLKESLSGKRTGGDGRTISTAARLAMIASRRCALAVMIARSAPRSSLGHAEVSPGRQRSASGALRRGVGLGQTTGD